MSRFLIWRPAASSEQTIAATTRTVVSLDIENMVLENVVERRAKVVPILDLISYIGCGTAYCDFRVASMCQCRNSQEPNMPYGSLLRLGGVGVYF